VLLIFALGSCAKKEALAEKAPSIAVFVPGMVSGSPIYEQLVAGARQAASEISGASVKVVEAGFNQADWLDKLSGLAATGEFDLIVTSNPAMPELCAKVAESFPKTRFFIADGKLEGNPAIHTVLYNQYEQGYLVGYLAGLLTKGTLKGTNPELLVGMVVAQSYPTLDLLIKPGFLAGLVAAAPGAKLEERTIGNWFDANKASELAQNLMDAGVDIILPIAGGAGQGVVSAVKSKGRYALWFDGGGYALAPDVILGCAVLKQDRLVYEKTKALLSPAGKKLYGQAEIVGAKEGYVDFDESGPAYRALSVSLKAPFEKLLAEFRKGSISFPVKGL